MRLHVRPSNAGASVFVGVGPADEVAAFLHGVSRDEFRDLEVRPFSVAYTRQPGGRPTGEPTAQTFWSASDSGPGPRTLSWSATEGDWAIVIMNTDASAGIDADVSVGGTFPVVRVAGIVTLVIGGLLLIAGLAMIVLPVTTRRPRGLPVRGEAG